MAKPPGHAVFGGSTVTLEAGNANLEAGMAVAFSGNRVVPASSGSGGASPYIGIAADSVGSNVQKGDKVAIHVAGVIVGATTSGVSSGNDLAASSTAGTLKAGSGSGNGVAFPDVAVLPSGHSLVSIGGVV